MMWLSQHPTLPVEVLSFACVFFIGVVCRNKSILVVIVAGIVGGLVADIVGQLIILGGGPGVIAGFICFPAYALVAGLLGRALGRWLFPAPFNDDGLSFLLPRCKTCGYCLKGLTERRCPECGTPF